MITEILRKFKKRFSSSRRSLDPDEIFLDSSNLPDYNKDQFEGRIEKPIGSKSIFIVGVFFTLIVLAFITKVGALQIMDGDIYADKSANNRLRHDIIFAHRGTIVDRNGKELVWNEVSEDSEFPKRKYIDLPGFSNLLGFIKYPQKDSAGFFYTTSASGADGIEKYFDAKLSGENGVKLTEVDSKGNIQSESTIEVPKHGETLTLSIDYRLQDRLAHFVANAVDTSGFVGGGGVIMSAKTGEVVALVTYPEYNSGVLTLGKDKEAINNLFTSSKKPFLDRAVSGLYAPGSIVKPFIGVGVLNENIIDPLKNIYSSGSISLPNPYNPEQPSIFRDWKAHGYVDMREAIAVSSDVYFYAVGGGFEDQKGLGINRIDEYLKKFMFTNKTTGFFEGPVGTIPTPEWKKANFNGDEWRIGDTYHTSIGQYGFQITPLQIARAMTGIANKGKIVSPTILKGEQGEVEMMEGISDRSFQIVKEGMRQAVTEGTAGVLNIPGVSAAAKTGTAEIGAGKQYVHSWAAGFVPYENPEYVFVVVLERGPIKYEINSMRAISSVLEWARDNAPEYVGLGEVGSK